MSEISEKEIEAAREAWREYWCEEDVPRNTRDGMTAALSAAARVREEDNAGEPVAWGEDIDGKIVSVRLDKSRHCTVPLYPAPQPSGPVKALADALRGLLKAYENAFDWTAELPPETAEAERIANEVLEALTAGKPEQSGWKLVPVEPTEEMCRALLNVDGWSVARAFKSYNWAGTFWKAMLAASPTPPTAGGCDE